MYEENPIVSTIFLLLSIVVVGAAIYLIGGLLQ